RCACGSRAGCPLGVPAGGAGAPATRRWLDAVAGRAERIPRAVTVTTARAGARAGGRARAVGAPAERRLPRRRAGGRAPRAPPPGAGARGNRASVVFVRTAAGLEPRLVRLGLSDFDWSEVLSGVGEGDQVVMLGIAQAQASRAQQQSQIRQRVGTMPGGIGGT